MDDTPLPPLRTDPRYGRAALIAVLVLGALFFLFGASSLGGPLSTVLSRLCAIGAVAAGAALATVSLIRGERRAPAVIALLLVVGGPLIVLGIAALVWAGYGAGLH